jgi:hypothetical protein
MYTGNCITKGYTDKYPYIIIQPTFTDCFSQLVKTISRVNNKAYIGRKYITSTINLQYTCIHFKMYVYNLTYPCLQIQCTMQHCVSTTCIIMYMYWPIRSKTIVVMYIWQVVGLSQSSTTLQLVYTRTCTSLALYIHKTHL